jgi:hypothetical protein
LIRLSQNLIFLSINLTFPKSPKPQSPCQKTKVCRLCGPCRCPEAWGQWLCAAPSLRAQGPQVPAFHTTLLESKTLGKARLARFGTKIVGFLGSWPAARRRSCGFIQFLFLLTFFLNNVHVYMGGAGWGGKTTYFATSACHSRFQNLAPCENQCDSALDIVTKHIESHKRTWPSVRRCPIPIKSGFCAIG